MTLSTEEILLWTRTTPYERYARDHRAPTIADMAGRTFEAVVLDDQKQSLAFIDTDGVRWEFLHNQDCCEAVDIEDVCGDLEDLVGTPLLQAEEVVHSEGDEGCPPATVDVYESYTWTFYKFGTVNGRVTVRWFGSSNGYYSERVDLSVSLGEAR